MLDSDNDYMIFAVFNVPSQTVEIDTDNRYPFVNIDRDIDIFFNFNQAWELGKITQSANGSSNSTIAALSSSARCAVK